MAFRPTYRTKNNVQLDEQSLKDLTYAIYHSPDGDWEVCGYLLDETSELAWLQLGKQKTVSETLSCVPNNVYEVHIRPYTHRQSKPNRHTKEYFRRTALGSWFLYGIPGVVT